MQTSLLSVLFVCWGIVLFAQPSERVYSFEEIDSLEQHHFEQGAYRMALRYAQMGIQKASQKQKKKDSLYRKYAHDLVTLYSLLGRYKEALHWSEENLQMTAAAVGRRSLAYANNLHDLGYLYKLMGRYPQAEQMYLRSLRLQQSQGDSSQPYFATCLNNLGAIYQHLGDYAKAERYYRSAQNLRYRYLPSDNLSHTVGLNNIAALYYNKGKYREAEQLFLEAQKKLLQHYDFDHPRLAVSYLNLAKLYKTMGRYGSSEQLFLRAKDIWQAHLGNKHPRFAIALNALAGLYKELGRYQEAKALYLEAKQIRFNIFGENNPHYAKSLHNLASLHLEMGYYEKAEPLYWQSYRIWKSHLGIQHPDVAENLQNLGDLYREAGDLARAEQLLLQSKSIRAKLMGIRNAVYASNLQSLGELYKDMNNYKKALPLLLEAKALLKESLGENHPRFLHNLHQLAEMHFQQGELKQAEAHCLDAIAHNIPQLSGTPCSIHSLSMLHLESLRFYSNLQINQSISLLLRILRQRYRKEGDETLLRKHYHLARTAMRITERMRKNFSAEEDQLRILRSNTTFIEQGIASALQLGDKKYIEEAFSFAELNKSMLLADALKGDRARSLGDLPDSLAQLEIELKNRQAIFKKRQYRAQTVKEKEEINRALSVLQLEVDAFLRSIKDKYPKYHALRYENITPTAKEIQQLLDTASVLVEYFITDSLVYVFTVDAQNVQLKALNISRAQLQRKVEQMRYALSDYHYIRVKPLEAFERYEEVAHWFYQALVEPVVNQKGIEHLILIPDGALGHLPFEAFLTQPAKQANYQSLAYLLHRYRISYHYSATLWKEQQRQDSRAPNAHLLAFAADYKGLSSKNLLRSASKARPERALRPLGATRKEVELLAEAFEGQFLYGASANEGRFKRLAPDYGVIHLAMHGLLHSEQPMLSSLAFSPSSDSLEDDFLQAYEVSRLPLRASLVVLSACETGYGKFEQGEGIISLARSFMYAGVPSLVVSLWQMSDASTAQIMRHFYQNLAQGVALDEALQGAKQLYIKKAKGISAHPAFWASFVQIGKNSRLMLQEKQQTPLGLRLIWLGAAAICLFLGIKYSA